MSLTTRHSKYLTLFSVVALSLTLFSVKGNAASFYTYDVAPESLACNSPNCASGATIDLSGTITTDGLGSLVSNDIVSWDLAITLTGQSPIRLTQNIGSFGAFGSPQISATASDLTITINSTSQGFSFGGAESAPASWAYGVGEPFQVLFYNTSDGTQYTAQQMFDLPSTFTASAVGAVATPEPASLPLLLAASMILLGSGLVNKSARHSVRRRAQS
jgi:hypothetical protein